MSNDISEVFSETEEATEAVEVKEEVTTETETKTEEETESTVEDDATTTVAEQDDAQSEWTKTAYLDEKRKRQELEEENRLLKAKPEEDDTDYVSQSELRARLQKEFDDKLAASIFQDRLQRGYETVKEANPDYPEMEKAFVELAEKDPTLKANFQASLNPAEFAYKHAKNHTLLNEYGGDVEKLIAAELEKAKKQYGIEIPEKTEKTPRTPSLANATESDKNSSPPAKATTLSALFEDSVF